MCIRDSVDALAIAIGTSHGAYKFSRPPSGDILAIERIREINSKLPSTHLVMHGSSSVPQDLIKVINENGGKIKEVPAKVNEIRPSVSLIYKRIPRTIKSLIKLRIIFYKESLKTKNL